MSRIRPRSGRPVGPEPILQLPPKVELKDRRMIKGAKEAQKKGSWAALNQNEARSLELRQYLLNFNLKPAVGVRKFLER